MAGVGQLQSSTARVVALIDMDCFECQIWQRMYPGHEYWGKPCVVADETGRISSVTYEARDLGISRSIRLREAQSIARRAKVDLQIFYKPNDREKPDGKTLRYASWEIVDAVQEYCQQYAYGIVMEYASIDEFFLDITEEVTLRMRNTDYFEILFESKTFLEGEFERMEGEDLKLRISNLYPFLESSDFVEEERLVYGALIMQELNNFIFGKTKFTASVGLGPNKLLAKLACGLNKPNGITIFPSKAVKRLGQKIGISSISGLGGKSGTRIKEHFGINIMNELAELSFEELEEVGLDLDKTLEAYHKSRGQCDAPVINKCKTVEVSCGKNFYGQITSDETLTYHLHCLAEELMERQEEERVRHRREATSVRLHLSYTNKITFEEQNMSALFAAAKVSTAALLRDNALEAWFKHCPEDVGDFHISRICLTARGFENI